MHLNLSFATTCMRAHDRSQRLLRLLCGCLLLIGVASVPRAAWADCGFSSGSATTVTFNAGTITLTPSTAVNTVLWTSNAAIPANPPVLACNGNTNGGIVNTIAASTPVNGDNTLIPTGIPGVSYRLLHPDASTLLALYPNYPTSSGTFNVATNLQLVYTGPYLPPSNSTLTGQLSQWKIDICDKPIIIFGGYWGCNGTVSPQPVETFNISAIIKIQVPTCNVDPGSVNKVVTLPSMTAAQLTASPTPGSTPFSLQLVNCPANEKVLINLNTATPYTGAGASGVIAPTAGTGYATNVGVQILNADGSTPVTFGDDPAQAINTGTTSGSSYAVNLYARYYRTGTPVGAGSVKGVATYTINYQ